MRSAPFLPMPGTLVSVVMSSAATAAASSSGLSTESSAMATRGPTPVTVWASSKVSRSPAAAKP